MSINVRIAIDTNVLIYDLLKETIEDTHPFKTILNFFFEEIRKRKLKLIILKPVLEEAKSLLNDTYDFLVNNLRDIKKKVGSSKQIDPYFVIEQHLTNVIRDLSNEQVQIITSLHNKPREALKEIWKCERSKRFLRYLEYLIVSKLMGTGSANLNKVIDDLIITLDKERKFHHTFLISVTSGQTDLYEFRRLSRDEERCLARVEPYVKHLRLPSDDLKILLYLFVCQIIDNTYILFITTDYTLLQKKDDLCTKYMIPITSPTYAFYMFDLIKNGQIYPYPPRQQVSSGLSSQWQMIFEQCVRGGVI